MVAAISFAQEVPQGTVNLSGVYRGSALQKYRGFELALTALAPSTYYVCSFYTLGDYSLGRLQYTDMNSGYSAEIQYTDIAHFKVLSNAGGTGFVNGGIECFAEDCSEVSYGFEFDSCSIPPSSENNLRYFIGVIFASALLMAFVFAVR
jgi:hypothetical protein